MGITTSSHETVPEPEPVYIDEYDTVSGKWRRVLLEDDDDELEIEGETTPAAAAPNHTAEKRDGTTEENQFSRKRTSPGEERPPSRRDANGIRCEEDEKSWLGYVRSAWIAHELTMCFDGEELPRWCGWCVASAATGAALSGDKKLWTGTSMLRVLVAMYKIYKNPGLPAPRVWLLFHELSSIIRHIILKQPWGVVADEGARSAIVMYFLFFFWRLNTSFLNTNTSCASISAAHWVVQLSLPAILSLRLAPFIGLILAAALPIALLLKPHYGLKFAFFLHLAGCSVSPATALDPALSARWLCCFAPNALATDIFWKKRTTTDFTALETSGRLGLTVAAVAITLALGRPRAALFGFVSIPLIFNSNARRIRRPLFLLPPSESTNKEEKYQSTRDNNIDENNQIVDNNSSNNDDSFTDGGGGIIVEEEMTPKNLSIRTQSPPKQKFVRNASFSFFFGIILILSTMLLDPSFAPGTNLGRRNHLFSFIGTPSRTSAILKVDKGHLHLPLTPVGLPPAIDAVLRALEKDGRVWRRYQSPYYEHTPPLAVHDLRSFLNDINAPATLSIHAPTSAKISFQRKPSHNALPFHNALLATCSPVASDVCRMAFEPPITTWPTAALPVILPKADDNTATSSKKRLKNTLLPVQCMA